MTDSNKDRVTRGMTITAAPEIAGVWDIEVERLGDERGYFAETFRRDLLEAVAGRFDWLQDNESVSRRGVLRGMHFQEGEWAQAKLVRVTRGEVLDVVVDLRAGSPTFGRHLRRVLSASRGNQMLVSRGFAHGYLVLSDEAQFQYKVDNAYAPQAEATLLYSDPALGIDWPDVGCPFVVSAKDERGILLKNIKPYEIK